MQDHASDIGAALRLRQWRSGSVLASASIKEIVPYLRHDSTGGVRKILPADWLVVISHTCDLYASTLKVEPFAELLHCTVVDKLDTNFTNQKSTRRLHFRPNRAKFPAVYLNAHATADRFQVPRELLITAELDSDRSLPIEIADAVRGWLALRYDRAAWPDELNDRLAPMRQQYVKALAPLNDNSTELRVAISPPSNEVGDFELAVFLIVDEEVWESGAENRATCQIAFNAFLSALNKTQGVVVHSDSQALSGADFSWQLMRKTDIWNFANLTPIRD